MIKKNRYYYLKRLFKLGFSGILKKIYSTRKRTNFCSHWRYKAENKQANHRWTDCAQKLKQPNFENFFTEIKHTDFLKLWMYDKDFTRLIPCDLHDKQLLLGQAEKIINHEFIILGAHIPSSLSTINWHTDVKTNNPHRYGFTHALKPLKNRTLFYHDIIIPTDQQTDFTTYNHDVKVPWELSRMHHLYILGRAHHMTTSPEQDSRYAQAFCNQINSWITANPFLLGQNWKCPMDVGIRAINLIWGLHFFKSVKTIKNDFWETLTCSLYDHFIYLENNWEYSDKPNNHYLAELLAYAYIADFFQSLAGMQKKLSWAFKKLDKQFNHQIQLDGTSYEGSTAYHKLDTEIYLHNEILKKKNDYACDHNKLDAMLAFLSDCTDHGSNLIQIGDNDSGKIVTGINPPIQTKKKVLTTYENFGLSIINQNNWHVTFRHPTYSAQQPSGHFHQDELAITLSVQGQPIIVDPGSYLYTANGAWRNAFRQRSAHSTFYTRCLCCTPSLNLFQLDRAPKIHTVSTEHIDDTLSLSNSYTPCNNQKTIAQRRLTMNKRMKTLVLHDEIRNGTSNHLINWHLVFHPAIEVKQKKEFEWIIKAKKNLHFLISSSHVLNVTDTFYSPGYGIKQCCTKLALSTTHPKITTIIKQIY